MADYGELGYLLAQRRGASQGGEGLGFLIGGGGKARYNQIYQQAAYKGAQMQDVLAQARQRQQQAIARENYANRERAKGTTEGLDLADQIMGGLNPSEFAAARETALKMQVQQEILKKRSEAAAAGKPFDFNDANALAYAFDPKFQQLTRVEGDHIVNAAFTPDQQTVTPTSLGKAREAELGSLVAEHNAQAARARAGIGADKAANYEIVDTDQGKVRVNKMNPNDTQPVLIGGKQVVRPPKEATPAKFTEPELLAAFGGALDPTTNKPTVDPVKFGQFMQAKAAMPGKSDADVWNSMREQEIAENTKAANTPSPEMLGNLLSGSAGAPTSAPAAGKSKGKPSLSDWMAQARQANPGATDDELTQFYNQKYGG